MSVFLTIYNLLSDSGLDILIHVGISETNHESVCPAFIHKADFTDNRLIMIGIVEAFYMLFLLSVDRT